MNAGAAPSFRRCGREAVLVEVADLESALALYSTLDEARPWGVVDLVPAARTVLIRLDPVRTSPAVVREQVAALMAQVARTGHVRSREKVEIPVRYDGADLAEVAALLDTTPETIVARHTGSEWTVAFVGFAPGFAYLTGGDPGLRVPRRSTPRVRIPAGSVALAGEFSGVYPTESPGGWQLIGSTTLPMWNLDRERPALLAPGDTVSFREVDACG